MYGENQSSNQNNVGDSYEHKQKIEQKKRKRERTQAKERTHENLFTQFDPILTYSRRESNSPFYYNDE